LEVGEEDGSVEGQGIGDQEGLVDGIGGSNEPRACEEK
jgi:hypothetical protein